MSEEPKHHRGVYEYPKGSGIFWILYYENGRRHRERIGKKSLAIKRYAARKTEILEGRYFPPRQSHTVEELIEIVRNDYRTNRKKMEPVETSWKRMKSTFANVNADSIRTDDLAAYIDKQLKAGYAPASINRDFAYLKRAYRLATRCTPPKVQRIPSFPERLREAPPRSGFVEREEYERLMAHAGEDWLRCFLAIAYAYGFRKHEILGLRIANIETDFIRLHHGTTKSGRGRIAPLTTEVRKYLAPCMKGKSKDDFLLTRDYGRVLDFRARWSRLIEAANLPKLLVHDLRRSAVRQLVRKGVPESVAMAISGHRTTAVFLRYDITSETDVLEAGKRLDAKTPAMRTSTTTKRAMARGQ
jgi:integrase